MKFLIVVDMQNDFITGSLGTKEAEAILCKATFPESDVSVDAACCACVTPQSHDTALSAMKLCQIDINNQGSEPWRA